MSNKGLWIALGVAAVLLLGGGTCLCAISGGFVWLVSGVDQADADDARSQREGIAAGPGLSGEECFQSAIQRRLACGGYVDPNCATQATSYLTACLQASTRVEDTLCNGVPAAAGFLETSAWAESHCTQRGYEPGSECEDVSPGIAAYCRAR
ncbi:MAG: hypothetical protein M3Y87_04725 [Myxococcota bacterium]|nr:hypothetical protein [Myxococcota bacterium]